MALDRRVRIVAFTLVALAGVAAVIAWFGRGSTASLLAPGPLARAHADLDSEAGCAQCHVARRGLDDHLCLQCHETLARRLERKVGFHARLDPKLTCNDCHGEHLGLDARLVRWPPQEAPLLPARPGAAKRESFAHGPGTGFPLDGAHAKLECPACHTRALMIDGAVLEFVKDQETYLGLGQDCASCHADAHAPSFGQDCARCHDATAWRPAPTFDHGKTRYPLTGAHAKVECAKCHLAPARGAPPPVGRPPVPTFQAIVARGVPRPFRGAGFGAAPGRPVQGDALPGCQACHANPHRAEPVATAAPYASGFQRCEDCHTAAAWTHAGSVASGATFDHARVGFALDGGHAKVTCVACHGPKLDRAPRTSCRECHEDIHKGAFDREVAVARQSCELCHGVQKWKPSTYVGTSHPLALIEGHAVACDRCHAAAAGFARLPARGAPIGPLDATCASCHKDPHEGRLSNDCASCHGFKTFHLAPLDAAGHARLGFPLREAHAKVACEGCHGARTPGGGLRRLALSEARTQGCVACHDDVHRGQLGSDCQACHTEVHFTPSTYDEARHRKARLALLGAHRAVPCEVCHVRDLAPPVPPAQRFRWEGRAGRCDACHQKDDPHRGQFAGQDCASCHGQEAWAPSTFDRAQHARSGFLLEGAHDRACAACHTTPAGGAVTLRGTPRDCASCHLDPHQGQFAGRGGADGCGACHGAQDWRPERFDHARSRFPLTGAHAQVECAGCHVAVTRQTDAGPRKVVHYYPIEERACDDCHENPHAQQGAGRGR